MSDTKLILSKKGFDSTYGGGPSPILADGRMIPLPIPEPRPGVCAATYGSLRHNGGTYADLLARLGYRVDPQAPAHLDPDLDPGVRPRDVEWRGMFGQVDQAESHLAGNGVGPGSLFLFWGWYEHANSSAFRRNAGFSALFGYLEVDQVLEVGRSVVPSCARHHPHVAPQYPRRSNRVYIARATLSWDPKKPGWGVFRFHPRLRLSKVGRLRSEWQLPGCFHPDSGCALTYNADPGRWGPLGVTTDLTIPARGQEFVCALSGRVRDWVRNSINESSVWTPYGEPTVANVAPSPTVAAIASRIELETDISTASPQHREAGPNKVIPAPRPGEKVVAYGDRLLWRQLEFQIKGVTSSMPTEEEFVSAVLRHFPDAVERNVRRYRNYFNGRHKSMGLRDGRAQPIPVEFAPPLPRS